MAAGHTDGGQRWRTRTRLCATLWRGLWARDQGGQVSSVPGESWGPPGAGESGDLGKWTDPGHHDCSRLSSGRGRGRGGEMAQACSVRMVWSTLGGRGAWGLAARWVVPQWGLGQALGQCPDSFGELWLQGGP